MDTTTFNRWNRWVATAVLAIASFTYLSTIEPTASFWDCGEFIASSYKLEVGHPPGNPVFQLIAHFFMLLCGQSHAQVALNALNALLSAATVFFLYLTLVFFAKRLVRVGKEGAYSLSKALLIWGAGAVGALSYCFSDTFWFSAVEGEVYAMSSLFTALVFWAMCRWYETADEPHASRWIVLISLLMGLSIGVHLLNLLTVPALVFLYYYRKRGEEKFSPARFACILGVGIVIEFLLVYVFVPGFPKLAAFVDRVFVNGFGLPYNSGAFFMLAAVLGGCFWGLFTTLKKGQVALNTLLLCVTSLVIGFSLFATVIIRAHVMPPLNEYQPDNPYTLVRYLNREQYGSVPLLYGQYFDAPYDVVQRPYWAPLGGKYVRVEGPSDAVYHADGKMFFPRMWSSTDSRAKEFYKAYTKGEGRRVRGAASRKPTFAANLRYFFNYQLDWMYWRYFLWNFVGRQNDVHSPEPGDLFYGNWESGVKFIDNLRLGDQRNAPAPLRDNKGKNHYFFLPLLLGLLGLGLQFAVDRRGGWIVTLMFFMTGIAIVVFLNQPPFQVRERDYAYAGSFYMFSLWIGLGVIALHDLLSAVLDARRKAFRVGISCFAVACGLVAPTLMAAQNWDDHDRSHRFTAVEMAANYLNSVAPNGYLVTHGDNDTFPLWYAQEVEGIRTDVRVLNTSLLGTDWYIGQMRHACNQSAPVPLSVPEEQYLYGTNEFVYIAEEKANQVMPLAQVMATFRDPRKKVTLEGGRRLDYLCARKLSIPVDKENCLKYGIVPERFADRIPDEIVLTLPKDKRIVSKPELFFLDLLSNYKWDRPLNMLQKGGDIRIGMQEYLAYDGFSYRFTPLRCDDADTSYENADPDHLYRQIMEVASFDKLSRTDWFVDYHNFYTFMGVQNLRGLFFRVAEALSGAGERDKALEVLDKCRSSVPEENFALDLLPLGFASNDVAVLQIVRLYYELGKPDVARDLVQRMGEQLVESAVFYAGWGSFAQREFTSALMLLRDAAQICLQAGDKELSNALASTLNDIRKAISAHARETGGDAPKM